MLAAKQIAEAIAYLEGAEPSLNATAKALVAAFGTKTDKAVIERLPFSSERKYSATLFEEIGAFALGAPHFVPAPISEEAEKEIAVLAKQGMRVLILASVSSLSDKEGKPMALIAMADGKAPQGGRPWLTASVPAQRKPSRASSPRALP